MDLVLGIFYLVALGLSVSGGLVAYHRMQDHVRHGHPPGAKRIDLRRQGYGPRSR